MRSAGRWTDAALSTDAKFKSLLEILSSIRGWVSCSNYFPVDLVTSNPFPSPPQQCWCVRIQLILLAETMPEDVRLEEDLISKVGIWVTWMLKFALCMSLGRRRQKACEVIPNPVAFTLQLPLIVLLLSLEE